MLLVRPLAAGTHPLTLHDTSPLGRKRLEVPPRNKRSLRELVTCAIREAIVYGELPPGTRLREDDLAEELEMSRGPVREALRQLEQEGLISSFPYRETVVAEISTEEVLEVLSPVRATLEQFALRSAFATFTQAQFDSFAGVVDEMAAAAASQSLARVVELDLAFHRLLVAGPGRFHTMQLWDLIAPRIRVVFFRMGPEHGSLDPIVEQHRELLEVFRGGDLELAQNRLADHIEEPRLYARLTRDGAANARP